MSELRTAQTFINNIINETIDFKQTSDEWYKTSFGRYLYKHGKETMEIYEDIN